MALPHATIGSIPEETARVARAALNDLATAAPEWLRPRVPADWFERSSARFEAYRLPKGEADR
jgi:transposase